MHQEKLPALDYQAQSRLSRLFPGRGVLLSVAAALLGVTIQITEGFYSPTGIALLTIIVALCAAAALMPMSWLGHFREPVVRIFLGALVWTLMLFFFWYMPFTFRVRLIMAPAMVGAAIVVVGTRRQAMVGFAMMLAIYAILCVWHLHNRPYSLIDVRFFHKDAAEALRDGINPYTITFRNVYTPAERWVYGEGIVKDGRLMFGYPYPPLTLLMTSAAQLGLGDSRYAMLIAMLVAATAIALTRGDQISMLAGAILLYIPSCFYVLRYYWTEPLSVMLLALAVLCSVRKPKLMPVMLGLLIASKQYLPASIFLTPMLWTSSGQRWKPLAVMFGVAALVTLPLALWDFKAFWWSVVQLQTLQPYRHDALSFLAWYGAGKPPDWKGPFWLAFVALFAAIGLSFWRIGRGPAGFAVAMAFCFMMFFAFNKQAFANYYYLVIGAMCCAVATESFSTPAISADNAP